MKIADFIVIRSRIENMNGRWLFDLIKVIVIVGRLKPTVFIFIVY